MKRWSTLALPLLLMAAPCMDALAAEPAVPEVILVQAAGSMASEVSLDAVVEAVRHATLSSQMAGAVVKMNVKAGDRVRAGQELARIDARVAQQNTAGITAQWEAAQAQLKVASKELERQQQLFQRHYISQGALDRAQAQWEAAQAQTQAMQAQAQAAQTQTGYFVIQAPFNGIISDVPVNPGDMVLPGRPLVVMHDPASLRITAAVPQTLLGRIGSQLQAVRFDVPGWSERVKAPVPASAQLLPIMDAGTHTAQLRLNLPAGVEGLSPGMFARVLLPAPQVDAGSKPGRIYLPAGVIVRRAEMTGVYVLDAQGKPRLRQIRLGGVSGDKVEILSGVNAGEKVILDPARLGQSR